MKVVKRDNSIVDYDNDKIRIAIKSANSEVPKKHRITKEEIEEVVSYIDNCEEQTLSVEEIQDKVEQKLMELGKFRLAKHYITYRYKRELLRKANTTDNTIQELLVGQSEYWNTENSNKNAKVVTTQRDYIAGIASTDIAKRLIFPENLVKAHERGIIHIHDMDYSAQLALTNCCLINLEDMLQNGTNINGVMIEKPHRLLTATTIATQIITAVASSQYGGTTISLTHLAPFVRMSKEFYVNKYKYRGMTPKQVEEFANEDLRKEIKDAVQTFNYQVNSMSTTNGQAPFLSVNMYLGEDKEYTEEIAMLTEEFLNQRILGLKNSKGVYVTQAFPKLIYVLEEDNIHPNSKYYYLTKLAAYCSAKRLVPDYVSEKVMKELKINELGKGDCYPQMGCRSFLTPDRTIHLGNLARAKNYVNGKPKYYGRFNMGVVTVNLVDVALSSKGDEKKFWSLLDKRCEMCRDANKVRIKRLESVTSDVAPILWQYGAFARLDKGEKLSQLLHNGYATVSLGYAGLYECVKYMTGKSHSDGEQGEEFGLKVMQFLNDKCKAWKEEENIDYSVYGSPIESTTYKFAKCLKKRFGVIEGITDRDYITNSYHIPVFEEINAFDKLGKEAKFQKLSPGGAISYVETPNLTNNVDAVMEVIKFIYDNIMYAELNTKSDYCSSCGYDGEMQLDKDLEWYCPNCGNRDHNLLYVTRRTCGYIGTNFWNKGRTQEIKERVLHLDNKEAK